MTRLTFVEGNHTYWLADPSTGKKTRVPSVSALKATLYPFNGEYWYLRQAADAIAVEWDALATVAPPLRADACEDAAKRRVGYPRDFGTAVHHYCEHLWTGEPVHVPEEYAGHVSAVASWWDAQGVSLAHAEAMCFADADDIGGPMAGRLDLMVKHPTRGLGLLDIKTWIASSAGKPRPAEWAFQLTAYSIMEYLVVNGEDLPFPTIDWASVLHVGPGGLREYQVTSAERAVATDQVDIARMLKASATPRMEEVG